MIKYIEQCEQRYL